MMRYVNNIANRDFADFRDSAKHYTHVAQKLIGGEGLNYRETRLGRTIYLIY